MPPAVLAEFETIPAGCNSAIASVESALIEWPILHKLQSLTKCSDWTEQSDNYFFIDISPRSIRIAPRIDLAGVLPNPISRPCCFFFGVSTK